MVEDVFRNFCVSGLMSQWGGSEWSDPLKKCTICWLSVRKKTSWICIRHNDWVSSSNCFDVNHQFSPRFQDENTKVGFPHVLISLIRGNCCVGVELSVTSIMHCYTCYISTCKICTHTSTIWYVVYNQHWHFIHFLLTVTSKAVEHWKDEHKLCSNMATTDQVKLPQIKLSSLEANHIFVT